MEEEISYDVFELFPDNSEHYVGTITTNKSLREDILYKYKLDEYINSSRGTKYSIILLMFEKIYGFTKGMNGFKLFWNDDESIGTINWNVDTWKIKKVENEPIQDQ